MGTVAAYRQFRGGLHVHERFYLDDGRDLYGDDGVELLRRPVRQFGRGEPLEHSNLRHLDGDAIISHEGQLMNKKTIITLTMVGVAGVVIVFCLHLRKEGAASSCLLPGGQPTKAFDGVAEGRAEIAPETDDAASHLPQAEGSVTPVRTLQKKGPNAKSADEEASRLTQTEEWVSHAITLYETNSADALAWAQQLPEGVAKIEVVTALAFEASRFDPLLALTLASALQPSAARDHLVSHAVSQWAISDPASANQWSASIEDGALKQRVNTEIAIAWAQNDPVAAGNFVMSQIPEGAEQDRAIVSVVQRWAQIDPSAAADWVGTFPAVPARDSALQNLVSLWSEQDFDSSLAWLDKLPVDPLKDQGLTIFAQNLASRSPEVAQTWVTTLSDANQQVLCNEVVGRFTAVEALPSPEN